MKKIISIILMISVLVLGFSTFVFAQDISTEATNSREVQIEVVDKSGNAISNAHVVFGTYESYTDSDGIAYFSSLPCKKGYIKLSADGFMNKNTLFNVPSTGVDTVYTETFTLLEGDSEDIEINYDSTGISTIDSSTTSTDYSDLSTAGQKYVAQIYENYNNTTSAVCAENINPVCQHNGKIYCFSESATYIYDIDSNSWETLTQNPYPKDIEYAVSAVGYGSKLYVLGGTSLEIYDINSNTWTEGTAIPHKRLYFTAHLIDGKIYIGGGVSDGNPREPYEYSSSLDWNGIDIYDISSGTWSSIDEDETPALKGAVSASDDRYIYFTGKHSYYASSTNRLDILDTETNTWSIGQARPAMDNEEDYLVGGSFTCIGGCLVYQGGFTWNSGDDDVSTGSNDLYIYIPRTDEWIECDISLMSDDLGLKDYSNIMVYNGNTYVAYDDHFEVTKLLNEEEILEVMTPQKMTYQDNYSTTFLLIDSGRNQSIAYDSNGNVVLWGEGYYPDGSGKMKYHAYPVAVHISDIDEDITSIKQVERGKNHTLILDDNGTVFGLGSNSNYPMGGTSTKFKNFTKITSISDVSAISAGAEFTLFLKEDGTLWGLGKNDKGQLGQGSTGETYYSIPVQITSYSDFTYIDAGDSFSLAIRSNGDVYTWGSNDYGQLGQNSEDSYVTTPTIIYDAMTDSTYGTEYTKVSCGSDYCLGLTDTGYLYSWGKNSAGQLGIGNKISKSIPTLSTSVYATNISDVFACYNQSFIINSSGKVFGFGYSSNGQLGKKYTSATTSPTAGGFYSLGITKMVGGNGFSIGLTSDGYTYSSGDNFYDTLGIREYN